MSGKIVAKPFLNACVACDDTYHRLTRAILSALSQYSAARSACGELESLAHRNVRIDTYPASEPPLAFAANRLT